MYSAVTVAEDSERGLVLGVPCASGDPYAAVSLYLLGGPGPGSATVAQRLRGRLAVGDHDVEVQRGRGVLTVTASCPSAELSRLLADLGEALAEAAELTAGPSCPNLTSPPSGDGVEELLRGALFVEDDQQSHGVGDGWSASSLVVAVTDGEADALAAAVKMLDNWPGRGSRRRLRPTVLRGRPLQGSASSQSEFYRLGVACPTVARDDPRYRACALAAMHLAAVDGPVSTRLRRDASTMYTVASRVHPELGTGWLSLVGVVRRTPRADAAIVFREALARLVEDPLDERRLEALRVRLLVRISRSLADNRGRCSDATSGILYGLPPDHQLNIIPGIAGTTREDLVAAVAAFDLSRLVLQEAALA